MSKSAFDVKSQKKGLTNKLVVGLERISEAYRVLLWDHAKEIGLSPIQIQLLIFLKFHKEELRTVSSLAQEFNMTKPTISDAVRVLHEKNLVEKFPGTYDARSSVITLTTQGDSMVEKTSDFASPIAVILDNLDEKERLSTFQTITKLIYELNKAGIITIQRTCFGCRFYEKKPKSQYCHFLKTDLSDEEIRLDCEDYVKKAD